MTIKTVWLVFGIIGPGVVLFETRGEARIAAKARNYGLHTRIYKSYRVVRAELRYPVKGKEKA